MPYYLEIREMYIGMYLQSFPLRKRFLHLQLCGPTWVRGYNHRWHKP